MRKLFLPCMLTALLAAVALPISGARRSKTVLAIYSNERSLPANVQVDENLRKILEVNTSLDLKYQSATRRFEGLIGGIGHTEDLPSLSLALRTKC
jgi:hypothetical protein